MSTPVEWTPESFAQKLRERSARRTTEPEVDPARLAYRRSAALLWSFDPATLCLPSGQPSGECGGAMAALVDDCVSRPSTKGVRWQLRPDVRRATLAALDGPHQALAHLEVNLAQVSRTGSAHFTHAFLTGQRPDQQDLDVQQLERVREAVTWLSMVPGTTGLPDPASLERRLARARLMEPMRALLRQGFEGRTTELARLDRHIGLRSRTLRERLGVGSGADRVEDLLLVVHGPGGIGKSTLVAKSLLDHLTDSDRFPFAYVDSERATVWLNEPLSLVAEMARQLAVQYPDLSAELGRLVERARGLVHQQRARAEAVEELSQVTSTRSLGRSGSEAHHRIARDDDSDATRDLGRLLRLAVEGVKPEPPFVVVLDSFEEAQYRASPVLDRMWSMLDALRREYPRTRVVVAGRAPVGHPHVDVSDIPVLELGELDRAAAQRFLGERGVGPRLAEEIVDRVGGSPLWLLIAARVATAAREAGEDEDWILDLPARRRRFFGVVKDKLIEGMLYERLLLHITNPEVRALAHPGMVLRRITPQLLREVVAPRCPDVDVPDDAKAQQLFDELRRELDLVEDVAPVVLKHRPDVRRVMLPLLTSDRGEEVREVERAAIAFYDPSEDPADRAEEVYHRLRLGQSMRKIRPRWLPECAPHLGDVDEVELSARGNRILNRLLSGTPDETPVGEDQVEWEQATAQEVENLLTQGFTDAARHLLRQRKPWTGCSPLHALEVETLVRLGDLDGARAAVDAALDAPDLEHCSHVRQELLLMSARIAAQAGDLSSAEADLDLAERVARHLGQDLEALGVLLARAKLHDDAHEERDAQAEELLVRRVEQLPDELLASHPALMRSVAAEVGDRSAEVLSHTLALVGLPTLDDARLTRLTQAIVEAGEEPAVSRLLATLAGDDPDRWAHPDTQRVRGLLESLAGSRRLDDAARRLLTIPDDSGALRQGIRDAMEEGWSL